MPFPSRDGYGEIGAQNLTQATRIALLRGHQLGVAVGVHRQGLLGTERDTDIAVLTPIVIEDDLVSRFFLQSGGSFPVLFSQVASRHLISVSTVFAAMVTHCRSATKGGSPQRGVGATACPAPSSQSDTPRSHGRPRVYCGWPYTSGRLTAHRQAEVLQEGHAEECPREGARRCEKRGVERNR